MRALPLALVLAGCAPPVVTLPGFDGVERIAALRLDESGALRSASEVRLLAGGVDLITGDEDIVVVGWAPGALGPRASSAEPLVARTGCAPRLPDPIAAARIDGEDRAIPERLESIPALSASWASELCPEIDLASVGFRPQCKISRCPWTVGAVTGCAFELELPCIGQRFDARVDPDGSICAVTAASENAPAEATCGPAPAEAPAVSRVSCPGPGGCAIDVYRAPPEPWLAVERVVVEEAPRLVLPRDEAGALGKLPDTGHLLGIAHDMAVLDDRVVVATSTYAQNLACGQTRLRSFALDDLSPLDTGMARHCSYLLASSGSELYATSVPNDRFALDVYDAQLALVGSVEIDDRAFAQPGEPDPTRPRCDRPFDMAVEGDRIYVMFVRRGDLPAECPGTWGPIIHVIERSTLRVEARRAFQGRRPLRGKAIQGALWIADSDDLRVTRHRLPDLMPLEVFDVPPGFARTDVSLFDFALDEARGELVVATIRDQPVIRRNAGPGAFAEHTFFLRDERDPVALWPRPFAGERGLVLGTGDADPEWPTDAALLDRASFTVLPGPVRVGYGPPRRLLSDGRGGVLALFGWEGALVRMRAL